MVSIVIALTFVCAGFAAICFLWSRQAQISAQSAHAIEQRALPFRPRVTNVERDLETLRLQVQRLQGRFYQMKAAVDVLIEHDAPAEVDEAVPIRDFAPSSAVPVCENWDLAKRRGPASEAASCECAYCVAKRAERAATKERLVPKSQADRVQAMRDGLAQP